MFLSREQYGRLLLGKSVNVLGINIRCFTIKEVIDNIVSKLNLENCQIKIISLVCGPKELIKRLNKDIECGIRTNDVLKRSLEYLLMYKSINSIKIDVSNLAPKSTGPMSRKRTNKNEIICKL